jgi:hypothetical protein
MSLTHSASRANPPRSPQTTRPVMCKRAVLPSEAKAGERRAVLVLDDVDSYTCVTMLLFRSGLRGIDAQVLPPALSSLPARWAEVANTRGGEMLSHAHTHTHKKSTPAHEASIRCARTSRGTSIQAYVLTYAALTLSSSARVWLSSTARTAWH